MSATARTLESYCGGLWRAGAGPASALRDASTGDVIAYAATAGLDYAAMLAHARAVGGPALRALTFHERAGALRALGKQLLGHKDEFYRVSYHTGATRADAWADIDGGIGTLLSLASKAVRELPNARVFLDGAVERLSRDGSFLGQHVCVPLEGVAVHINAFNFPVWGMLEKLAPALLAGMPVIVKPATATAYLTECVVRRMVATGLLPPGSLQLIAGGAGDLFDHLTCQDVVSFTGSASTAAQLRTHPAIVRQAVRFIAETDSLNGAVLGPDARPGTAEFDLYIKEVVREMTSKAGQKCTAIRRILVPAAAADEVCAALAAALDRVVVGDPRAEGVQMGPLASRAQRSEVLARIDELTRESERVCGDVAALAPVGADPGRGAFLPPVLLRCRDPASARAPHAVEAFGPVATLVPYRDIDEALVLARRGAGSLVGSVFTADDALAAQLVLGLAPFHGRLLVVNRHCAAESTGHGSPLAPLVHGGPGRAGGGEELGGMRAVLHYMQRTAVQGSPDTLSAVGGRWVRGGTLRDPGRHPFRKPFDELRLGDTFRSPERTVTVQDIEAFAALSGDHFYAHMDPAAAARNPLFGGRVAHGYFLIAAAAGLFVDPAYGPVLGNYGLDSLRYVKPARPGDRIKVRLTCMQKSLRADKGWGEVRWDTEITNQDGETVASYEVLTMISVHAVPDQPGAA
ncbi:MAG: phenylacetic acid degradation bifunctional protein PaaZ [Gammaproteobacteria bacterium]|nr:phenylacetic acid degradation bifunctional protein PaaZ [Gammaproteobacteria bacterium]